MSSKTLAIVGLIALFGNRLTTCRSPGEGGGDANQPAREKAVELKGVDTASLTARERADWSAAVSELLTPCADQPVSVAQCVNESRSCRACLPAARYLAEQVRRGRTRSQVDAAYRARFAPDQVKNIEIADAPSKGPSGAPVVIIEFADFECPACGSVRPVLDDLMQKNPDAVRLVFKHFPLSMHQNAEKAARAAVAAQRQGKFWEMHALMFENQTQLNLDNVEKLAQKAGLDLVRFRQDRDSEATADFVNRDRKQGEALDLQSTPSLFINGRQFQNGGEFPQELEAWVKLELELLGAAPSAAAAVSAAPTVSAAPAASAVGSAAPAPAVSASVAAPAVAASAKKP
jgi:protein-disulfide isomerase